VSSALCPLLLLLAALLPWPLWAQPPASVGVDCGGDFGAWRDRLQLQARAAGLSPTAVALLDGVTPSDRVLAHDRGQTVFTQDWLTFAGRMVNAYRLKVGRQRLAEHAETFARAEQTHGVPGPVIAAFWGLETDYGAVQGDIDTLAALATLAHDCRRPQLFRPQLLDALRLVDLGWLEPSQLRGAWAGELGQVQLLPSDYLSFGRDGNGDGRVRLKESRQDVIMTAAAVIEHLGWRAGEPWLSEVQVPADMDWARAGVYQRWPRRDWIALGLEGVGGTELPRDELPAALLLPMGRDGPAFLAYPNFNVFLNWNQSLVYSLTAAYFATRLQGAPAVTAGDPEPGLDAEQLTELQRRLVALGHDVGAIDGILGAKTRAAVRAEQQRLGLPADAWPTQALLSRLPPAD
jgi:lytic murein transglycosylase